MLDFIRIACAVPTVSVGNVEKNAQDICDYIAKADAQKADVLLLPELALTGFTCADLFFQDALTQAVYIPALVALPRTARNCLTPLASVKVAEGALLLPS